MDTPLDTPLSRVERLLKDSRSPLSLDDIMVGAGITKREATASLKALAGMAQIDVMHAAKGLPTRYVWLKTEPVAAERPPAPQHELTEADKELLDNVCTEYETGNGAATKITGDGSGEALPELPMLDGTPAEAIAKAFAGIRKSATEGASGLVAAFGGPIDFAAINADALIKAMADYRNTHYSSQTTRYAVAIPRRPLRIVKSRARAEALALSAVRRGAKGAEVFALTPLGRAKRDATFRESRS